MDNHVDAEDRQNLVDNHKDQIYMHTRSSDNSCESANNKKGSAIQNAVSIFIRTQLDNFIVKYVFVNKGKAIGVKDVATTKVTCLEVHASRCLSRASCQEASAAW